MEAAHCETQSACFQDHGLTWIVERTFAWLGHNRRFSEDYEYRVQTSETLLELPRRISCSIGSHQHDTFQTPSDIHKATVRITTPEGPALDQYWESGPQFTGWGEVVGEYPDGTPAIVEGSVGQGWVVLSGVHPEAPKVGGGNGLQYAGERRHCVRTNAYFRSAQPDKSRAFLRLIHLVQRHAIRVAGPQRCDHDLGI
jgi:hypothetical protein